MCICFRTKIQVQAAMVVSPALRSKVLPSQEKAPQGLFDPRYCKVYVYHKKYATTSFSATTTLSFDKCSFIQVPLRTSFFLNKSNISLFTHINIKTTLILQQVPRKPQKETPGPNAYNLQSSLIEKHDFNAGNSRVFRQPLAEQRDDVKHETPAPNQYDVRMLVPQGGCLLRPCCGCSWVSTLFWEHLSS